MTEQASTLSNGEGQRDVETDMFIMSDIWQLIALEMMGLYPLLKK